ncbi:NADH dehydrogenase [Beutenbergia cavernae DSM 12333]|uniref:NADH dehydrogenase n=1 Tax=Beutenbergia cavernae (strain ATCC BAA-8 / DSM 12333 / CCUG 43141 / JCM 11478 / NBRC 16432 / NCIMB 13614 / HKI 0122) TaxID=471853 RepID=C5C0A4_BEUC1|nr:NAD(P)/FAD-dependent oxidoreductase [Beutenbergia cavernae]ACQ79290.1 NADH dehydrogenase [Beutenbergia cavernae DSM 12333]
MSSSIAPTHVAARPRKAPRVLILGGGYVGLYTAMQLRKRMGRRDAAIVVVDPRSYMTYQPFLPEAAAGSLEPRHVVAPHRRELRGTTVLTGRVTAVRHAEKTAQVTPIEGESYWVRYDHLVVALGAVARTLPIPGLADVGIGFKQIEEAIALRNQVLNKMDVAASTWDPEARRRMLTFTFVGGGFAGIEALAEVEDMARAACKDFDSIDPEDLRFVLVEASPRILPELGEELGGYALEQLRARGIDIKLSTFLNSCEAGHVKLSTGEEFFSDTIVWTAGVKANPVLQQTDLPLDEVGRVRANANLQVVDADGVVVDGAWAAGDCAAVPDLARGEGQFCAPTAQHAVRQAKHLGENLALALRGEEPLEYRHANLGTVATLGLGKGVAQIMGVKFRGPVAWFFHRTYHMWAMPTFNRKVRIVLDWTTALLFHRELVALGSLQSPRAEFIAASAPPRPHEALPTPPQARATR